MANPNLKQLLVEYDTKRNTAIDLANRYKIKIYNQYPRLAEIDSEITSYSLATAKLILKNNNKTLLDDLKLKINQLNKEKDKILKKYGLSQLDFLPKFECEQCNDTGYILDNNNYSSVMCNCLKQKLFDLEYNKINMFDIKNKTFANFKSTIFSQDVDKQKYNSNISPRENIEIIKKICLRFVNNFDNPDEKNLLFTGNTGLGKTFLSNCIANELLKNNKTVLYQTAPIMMDMIIDAKMGKNNNSDLIKNILSVDLLIIDDLGTEGINSMKFSELFTILNSRLLNQNNKITKTIISTNLSLQNLSKIYGERITSRFVGNYNICYFFGDDLRFNKLK